MSHLFHILMIIWIIIIAKGVLATLGAVRRLFFFQED
jgi:type IV secretory pathway TrbL component